jgi:hypothetical protein
MKPSSLPSRVLLVPVAVALIASLHAQSNATPPALGLLRLKSTAKANDAAPLATGKFAVDDLSAAGVAGAAKSKRNNVDYVSLDAGKEWSRPLRGNGKDVTFVSFQVYASQTTIIDIAGARLGFTASPVSGSLQVMFDDSSTGTLQWKSLNVHVATGTYGGKPLAALPVLTVALDPATSTWHLYSGSRLLADHLPLIAAKGNDRKFTVTAGKDGAWLAGLVLADENPLYQDDNFNGIDDAFEKQQRGVLLPAAASLSEQQLLAKQWRDAQRAKPPPALFVQRTLPDGR